MEGGRGREERIFWGEEGLSREIGELDQGSRDAICPRLERKESLPRHTYLVSL